MWRVREEQPDDQPPFGQPTAKLPQRHDMSSGLDWTGDSGPMMSLVVCCELGKLEAPFCLRPNCTNYCVCVCKLNPGPRSWRGVAVESWAANCTVFSPPSSASASASASPSPSQPHLLSPRLALVARPVCNRDVCRLLSLLTPRCLVRTVPETARYRPACVDYCGAVAAVRAATSQAAIRRRRHGRGYVDQTLRLTSLPPPC